MDTATNGACLLLFNIPPGSFCGIDLLSFTTSPRFHGIRQLPEGWHVIFTGVNSIYSIRHGSWFYVQKNEDNSPQLILKNWNANNEELAAETDVATILKWRANIGSIWREGLTPYRQSVPQNSNEEPGELTEERGDWPQLTDCISTSVLSRITGSPSIDSWSLTSASCAKIDQDHIPGLSGKESAISPERELQFLPVNLKRTWREGAIGRERTLAARDRSWALDDLIQKQCEKPEDILGELQFCFLMVLTLNNYSCLEQWKRLLNLLLTCEEAISQRPEFFVRFLSSLRLQMEHCKDAEGGLFDLSDEGGTLLRMLLMRFRKGLEPQTFHAKVDVMDELDDLEELLKSEHGWEMNERFARRGMLQLEDGEEVEMDMGVDYEDESGDYLPVVVDLTPEQAQEFERQHNTSDRNAGVHNRNEPQAQAAKEEGQSWASGKGELTQEDEDDEEEMSLEEMDVRY